MLEIREWRQDKNKRKEDFAKKTELRCPIRQGVEIPWMFGGQRPHVASHGKKKEPVLKSMYFCTEDRHQPLLSLQRNSWGLMLYSVRCHSPLSDEWSANSSFSSFKETISVFPACLLIITNVHWAFYARVEAKCHLKSNSLYNGKVVFLFIFPRQGNCGLEIINNLLKVTINKQWILLQTS